jgi:hypothetical protein
MRQDVGRDLFLTVSRSDVFRLQRYRPASQNIGLLATALKLAFGAQKQNSIKGSLFGSSSALRRMRVTYAFVDDPERHLVKRFGQPSEIPIHRI